MLCLLLQIEGTNGHHKELGWHTTLLAGWDSDGIVDGVVMGAVPGPDPDATCTTFSRFTQLLSARFATTVRSASWAPDSESIIIRMWMDSEVGVEVHAGPPLLQKLDEYSERFRDVAFSSTGTMALALKDLSDIIVRTENPATGFFEFVGRGPCSGAKIATVTLRHSLTACRIACAQARKQCHAITWQPKDCRHADATNAAGYCTVSPT